MTARQVDFALFGSTVLTRLLAGLLRSLHGRSVLLVGESQARFRLPRNLDLSVAPVTRPQTWELLQRGAAETADLLKRMGARRSLVRTDPIFFADTAVGKEALSHFRHMAQAFGQAAEKLPPAMLGQGRDGVAVRDAVLLDTANLEPLLENWLAGHAVKRVDALDDVEWGANGAGRARWAGEDVAFGMAVLCDDAAIVAHGGDLTSQPTLTRRHGTTVLCRAVAPLAAPLMHQLDQGLSLLQRDGHGLVALGGGGMDRFLPALENLLGRRRSPEQIGQAEYATIRSADAAPVIGALAGGATIFAGLGPSGAFLAPSLARWLCGTAAGAEAAWLIAHGPDRDPASSFVAEWSPA